MALESDVALGVSSVRKRGSQRASRTLALRRCARIAALIAGAALLTSNAVGQEPALTADERTAIERGDLVAREWRATRDGQSWIGGVSYLRVPRSRDEVWRAVHDVPRWRSMLPATTETRVEETSDDGSLVAIRQAFGPFEARYALHVHFDERAHRCTFELAPERPHDVRAGHGFLEVDAWPGEHESSVLVWAVLANPGEGLLVPLALDAIQHWSVRVPSTIRAFLEGDGATLYRD
jgi:hypothetical protein